MADLLADSDSAGDNSPRAGRGARDQLVFEHASRLASVGCMLPAEADAMDAPLQAGEAAAADVTAAPPSPASPLAA
jgi:hypothetical protein